MGGTEFGVLISLLAALFAFGWLDVHWGTRGHHFIISGFALVGGLLPITLLLVAHHAYQAEPRSWWLDYFSPIAYTLCPPCIAGLANLSGIGPQIFLGASVIMMNALLYALIGTFVRLGIVKNSAFLAVPIAVGAGMMWWGAVFLK
ncbi:hypothetical protein [Taklimakanibacter albus]|uniref:Uncharacterized protein n=1 Tax=Taklimakanibacter albus TaxID=2800327 RepID=A0ACC5RB93_9HYPH|nr:hypothetical protein [Aestuariivirga sp. YIM B02566]MBK1869956.1 hypothetical protein [Aestuariivirga sp. YIM B02566]